LALDRNSAAQDAIRVGSDEVLVPTVVFYEELCAQLNAMKAQHRDYYGHLVAKNQKLWDSIVVRNLTAKDFQSVRRWAGAENPSRGT
jgi:hypothetical protein